jgi:hypothetical protein
MQLHRLLENSAFEPLHLEAMSYAFEAVCIQLRLANRSDPICDIVAEKVIELAQCGERDPARLRDRVLEAIKP